MKTDFVIYAAGGAVRDKLLEKQPRDIDYVFSGTEQEFIQKNPSARKVAHTPCSIYLLDGYEYTPLKNNCIEDDLAQRDLTLNALLLDHAGRIYSHPLTFTDLYHKKIRPVALQNFLDDPVRVFRAARFAALLDDFTLHPSCDEAMRLVADHHLLHTIAAEQIERETRKALCTPQPGNYLRELAKNNCLVPWFIELDGACNMPAGPPEYHSLSLLEHTALVMDTTAALSDNDTLGTMTPQADHEEIKSLAVWMALCHDLGKTTTPTEILPHHYGHEHRGVDCAIQLHSRLKLPRRFLKAGQIAARYHMQVNQYSKLRPGTKVTLLHQLHINDLLIPFLLMTVADSGSEDHVQPMIDDIATILSVQLPEAWRNRGELSGKRLFELRCRALYEKMHSHNAKNLATY